MNSPAAIPFPKRRRPPAVAIVLSLASVLFIGILVFAYVVTKRTNPIFLDQNGKPVQQQQHGSH